MSSYPIIISASGVTEESNTYVSILWKNIGNNGWVKFSVLDDSGNILGSSSSTECFAQRINFCYKTDITLDSYFSSININAYSCKDDAEICDSIGNGSCTVEEIKDSLNNVITVSKISTQPAVPTNLVIIPDNEKLAISWDYNYVYVPGFIFGFYVEVYSEGWMRYKGYTDINTKVVILDDLFNKKIYDITIKAISASNVTSTGLIGHGIPELPPLNSITIGCPSYPCKVISENSLALNTVCKDINGNVITCPTLDWSSSDSNIISVPNGISYGKKEGSVLIKAKYFDEEKGIEVESNSVNMTSYKCADTKILSLLGIGIGAFIIGYSIAKE